MKTAASLLPSFIIHLSIFYPLLHMHCCYLRDTWYYAWF